MEIIDTEFGKLPPRTNFVLSKSDRDESGLLEEKLLYGVQDIIDILKFNKEEAKIGEFLFIIRKQGEAIKEKINQKIAEDTMPVENIKDLLPKHVLGVVQNIVKKEMIQRAIQKHGRYRLNMIDVNLTNLISYRLHPNIVKSIRIPVKFVVKKLKNLFGKLKQIKNVDGYKNVVIIKNEVNTMVSNFFQNTIFKLSLEEQYEYLVTCFPRIYMDEDDADDEQFITGFGTFVNDTIQRLYKRYTDYYDNQRIMLSSVVKGNPYIRILKAGTILYRGTPRCSIHKNNTEPTFLYFTHNPFVALLYATPKGLSEDLGQINVHEVQTDLRILDFSNYRTIDYIIRLLISLNAPNDVIKSIVFGWFNEGNIWMNSYHKKKMDNRNAIKSHSEIKRHSDTAYDFLLSEWICSNGFNGYIGLGVKKGNGEVFHDEVMLCNPSNKKKMKYLGDLDKEYINYNLGGCQSDWYKVL